MTDAPHPHKTGGPAPDYGRLYFVRAMRARNAPEHAVDSSRLRAVLDAEYVAYKRATGADEYLTSYRRLIGELMRSSQTYARNFDRAFMDATEFYRHV
jgi:hypothetical protein